MNYLWRKFWYLVWRTSELFGFSLGRFAPWIFGQMIGASHYKRIDQGGNDE